ncbi:MAG TPA: hypothetical protein VFA82_09050 [Gaiellaceae bacterium]|nr:hypothetical protein [Gaiellaceae bacterium]
MTKLPFAIGWARAAVAVAAAALAAATLATAHAAARKPVALGWLQMVDARRGYALAAGGDTFRLLATSDGARTWRDVTPGRGAYRATGPITIDGSTLLFSTRLRGHRFAVERSDDGGRSWRRSRPFGDPRGAPAPGAPIMIDSRHLYLAVNEGAAAGSSGEALFASSDGGRTWAFVSGTQIGSARAGTLPFGCDKDGFGFATPMRGFAGGYCAGGLPFFYRSDDGGRTWRRQLLPVPRQCACETTPPVFFSRTAGVLSVYGFDTDGAGTPFVRVLWTRDGGDHWRGGAVPAGRAGRPVVVDPRTVWLAGQKRGAVRSPFDRLFRTVDGGTHWQVVTLPFDGQNSQLDPVGARIAFALDIASGSHAVRVTRDGGRSWRALEPVLVG